MPTTSSSTPVVVFDPTFTDPERGALAGLLSGSQGATRDGDSLDLRQFVSFCDHQPLRLFDVHRSDIERYARTLEETGQAPTTAARRPATPTPARPCGMTGPGPGVA